MESTQRRLCIPRQQMPNYDFMYIIIITFFFFFGLSHGYSSGLRASTQQNWARQ